MVASYLATTEVLVGTEYITSGTNGEGTKFVGQDFTFSDYRNPVPGVNHIKYETINKVTIVSLDYQDVLFRNKKSIKVTVNGMAKIIHFIAIIDNHNNKRINFQISGDVFGLSNLIGSSVNFKIELI